MKEAKDKLRKELFKTMVQLATAGFGLVAALAWNEAIQSMIREIIPSGGSNLISKIIYALIVTLIAVSVTYSLGKMAGSDEEESKNKK